MKVKLGILMAIVIAGLSIAPVLGATGGGSPTVVSTRHAGPSVPMLLDYQGRLTDAGGTPLSGSYTVVFSIYSLPTGGTPLWSETQIVTVTDGLFSVLLGSQAPLTPDLFGGSSYLGVRVGADAEMAPRQRLASVPYAFVAERAKTLDIPLTLQLSYSGNLLELVNPAGGVLRAQSQGTAIEGVSTANLPAVVARNAGNGDALAAENRGDYTAAIAARSTGGGWAVRAVSQGSSEPAIVADNGMPGGGGAIRAISRGKDYATISAANNGEGTAIYAWGSGSKPVVQAENIVGAGSAIEASSVGNTRPTISARNSGQGSAVEAQGSGAQPAVLAQNTVGPALVARSQQSLSGEATLVAENTGGGRAINAFSRSSAPTVNAENSSLGTAISANNTSEYRPTVDFRNAGNGLAISASSRGISDIQKKETNATVFADNTGGGIAVGARSASGLFGTIRSSNTGAGPAIEAIGSGPAKGAVEAVNTDNSSAGEAPALVARQEGRGIAVKAENSSTLATIQARNDGAGRGLDVRGGGETIALVMNSADGTEVLQVRGQGGGIRARSTAPLNAAVEATNSSNALESGGWGAAVVADQTGDGWAVIAKNKSDTRQTLSAWNEGTGSAISAVNGDPKYTTGLPTIWAVNRAPGPALRIDGAGQWIMRAFDLGVAGGGEVFHIMGNGGGAMSWASHQEQPALMGVHSGSNNGVYGESQSGTGGYFRAYRRDRYALEAENAAGGDAFNAIGNAMVQGNLNVWGNGVFSGNLQAANLKTAIVDTESYGRRLLYAVESPTVVFEDFGTARLEGGYARVDLEAVFAQTVNTELPYQVFLTPLGESGALYVAEKGRTYFAVRESGGGTSAVSFDYRIVAKRKGYEGVRLQEFQAGTALQAGR